MTVSLAADRVEVFGAVVDQPWVGLLRVAAVLAISLVVLAFARKAIPRAIHKVTDVTSRDERSELRARTLSGTLITVITVAVWIFVVLTALGEVNINVAPLLAGAGVAGLAIGFGAQQLVRDVISGFFILAEDQFGVGDTVTVAGVTGTVETVSLRITRVRGDDGVLHHVRNGDLGVVSNASRGWANLTVDVPVDPSADIREARDALAAAMEGFAERAEFDGQLLVPPTVLGITELRPDAVIIRITARTVPTAKAALLRAILTAARDALADHQIALAPKPVPR